MPVAAIDKLLVRRRFCRSADSYEDHALVQAELAARLCAALGRVVGADTGLGRVLELGCGSGLLTRLLAKNFSMSNWTGNDMACGFETLTDEMRAAGVPETGFIHGDMEASELGAGWDVVCANASFQWLTEPVSFVSGLPRLLAPRGLLVYSTFGPDNLAEISAITGHGLTYATRDQHADAISRNCELHVAESYHRRLEFDTPRHVLWHLRATGVNAVTRACWGRRELERFCAEYCERFGCADGRVGLTYQPMLFVARAEQL